MSDLSTAATALGIPEDLLQRSADARAAADGVDAAALIAAWAGGAPAPEGQPSAPATQEVDADVDPVVDEVVVVPATLPEAPAAQVAAGVVAAPPAPDRITGSEALGYHAVVTVPTAGLSERTTPSTPKWLSMVFIVAPLLGLIYLITFANGPNCGVGGQLSVDRLTGAVENCDGSEFLAAGAGITVDVRAIISEGAALYSATPGNCTSCHASDGSGSTGPALNGGSVLSTFAACSDHIEWVSLATTGFQAAGRATYGDNASAVGGAGQMTGFAETLTPEQIASVVYYERVTFGGQDPNEAATDCGFVEPEPDQTVEPAALGE